MNKTILKQALLFEDDKHPNPSQIKQLKELSSYYSLENDVYFLEARRGLKSSIVDMDAFFIFLSDTQEVNIRSFEDIKNLLEITTSRKENIKQSGNSKNTLIRIFDNVVVVKKRGEKAQLYDVNTLNELTNQKNFLAIENGETFLNIDKMAKNFQEEYFVYLSGYANSLTREFLKTKKCTFFVDFDIEGMNIYESFECEHKELYIPKNIEYYFSHKRYNNVVLYKEQRARLRSHYSQKSMPIIKLIQKYTTVVEQEIIDEA